MMEKGIWYNRKGEELKIKEMETNHIVNAMAMLIGKMYLTETGIVKGRNYEMLISSLDKYEDLLREYKRRVCRS